MKVLVAVLALAAVVLARPEEEFYSSKYDNFNIDDMMNNKRLLKSFVQCFLDEGKCSPEGNDIKQHIPDALQSTCGKCSEKQRVLVAKMMKVIQEQLPEDWTSLRKKFKADDGQYDAKFEEFTAKYAA